MIDLSSQSGQIEKWMGDNIQRFLTEFSERPTSIALYSSPINGWLSLYIDVIPRPDCPLTSYADFSHPRYALHEFPEWQYEHQTAAPIIKRHDGVIVRLSQKQDDDIFNRPFFDFFMRLFNDYYHGEKDMFRPTWGAVKIMDSRYCYSFWRIHQPKNS